MVIGQRGKSLSPSFHLPPPLPPPSCPSQRQPGTSFFRNLPGHLQVTGCIIPLLFFFLTQTHITLFAPCSFFSPNHGASWTSRKVEEFRQHAESSTQWMPGPAGDPSPALRALLLICGPFVSAVTSGRSGGARDLSKGSSPFPVRLFEARAFSVVIR